MKFDNQKQDKSNIQTHNPDEYEYPYLYTHDLSHLYAYPIINHGEEWYRDASCIPYDNTAFCIENEVVKKHSVHTSGCAFTEFNIEIQINGKTNRRKCRK